MPSCRGRSGARSRLHRRGRSTRSAGCHSVTGGVYRIAADGFSLVIKIVAQRHDADPDALWVSGDSPTHRNYWKREWLAYSTGLLDALPGELRAPRMLLATEPADDECWIWMEDVEGRPGAEWRDRRLRQRGVRPRTTQAAYASGRSVLPGQPWLSRQWLRGWVDTVGQPDRGARRRRDVGAGAAGRDACAAAAGPGDVGGPGGAAGHRRDARRRRVVHLDFWPTNLIAADDGTTVAIDWSQVGIGAVGQDLDQLILDPVWMQVLPDASLDALQTHVLRGYAVRPAVVGVRRRRGGRWAVVRRRGRRPLRTDRGVAGAHRRRHRPGPRERAASRVGLRGDHRATGPG